MTTSTTNYASTLLGVARLARDRRLESIIQHGHCTTEPDRMIQTGRCQAYAEILLLITGRRTSDEIDEIIASMDAPRPARLIAS